MNARSLAIGLVRAWTRLYTWHMPKASREERRAEIESDLWESQYETDQPGNVGEASQILVRLILGIPDDLSWRIEQTAIAAEQARSVVVMATAAGGVLFLVALSAITVDAKRPQPASSFVLSTRGMVEAVIADVMVTNTPDSWKMLQAGILSVAVPVTGTVPGDVLLAAQTSGALVSPTFEAASIKANKSGDVRTTMAYLPGGRFVATNVSLGRLIRDAYQRSTFDVSGGPNWMESGRFDIAAKAVGDPPPAEMRMKLRALLTERYQLTVRHEMQERPVYELVLARNDGEFGPQLRRALADCTDAPAPPPPPFPDGPPSCGFIGPLAAGAAQLSAQAMLGFRGVTMEGLTKFLAPAVRRSVIDRTALTGYFDGEIDRTTELQPPPPPPGYPDPFDRQSLPSMFTVLQERLGLKLQSSRATVDVLVIDSAAPPTPD